MRRFWLDKLWKAGLSMWPSAVSEDPHSRMRAYELLRRTVSEDPHSRMRAYELLRRKARGQFFPARLVPETACQ